MVDRFVSWPTDVLRPTTSLQARLALRIAEETGKPPVLPPARQWSEPEWEQVAPGIECKLLATDTERHRVSMLVRLAPGASYPAHTHAGVEELHLLDGELWIDGRKLVPGDYNYGAPGARRRARLERDRLHLRSRHQHQRYPSLKRWPGRITMFMPHGCTVRAATAGVRVASRRTAYFGAAGCRRLSGARI